MNCETLNTAAQILEAFRACKKAGEEIDLFECLATRSDPPVSAFVEILQKIKLEPVLALTLQAFGKITDADVMQRLKQSDDLLIMLSEQARSGSTDLIRWAAATTIDKLGFDFIAVSQHLSEEPRSIAEKIMQSKMKRFADDNLTESNDYDEYLLFWTYGDYNQLRKVTLDLDYSVLFVNYFKKKPRSESTKDENYNKFDVCYQVISSLQFRGIKDIIEALRRSESMGNMASSLDENEIFEGIGQFITMCYPKDFSDLEIYKIAMRLLGLQSNNPSIRNKSASYLLDDCGNFIEEDMRKDDYTKYLAAITFGNEYNSVNYHYKDLVILSDNLKVLSTGLSRTKVKKDCQVWSNSILEEIQQREKQFKAREKISQKLKDKLKSNLAQIEKINFLLYEQVLSGYKVNNLPDTSVENEQYKSIFENYDKSRRDEALYLSSEVNKFYKTYNSSQLARLEIEITNAE